MIVHAAFYIKLINERANILSVGLKIVGQYIRIGQPQCEDAPKLRHQRVVFVTRIAKMIHPEKIIVKRVIDAVGAVEFEADRRDAEKIQEDGVV